MICPRATRRPCAGFSLFELVVVLVVISLFVVLLLNRLGHYQELAEKVVMEQTIVGAKSGLQMQIAALIARGREREIAGLANRNPVDFLAEPPKGYTGEFYDPRAYENLPRGSWYFDAGRREFVYLPNRDSFFAPGPDGIKWVRYKVVIEFDKPKETGSGRSAPEFRAARLISTNAYKWGST